MIAVDHIFLATGSRRSVSRLEYLGSAGGGTIPNTLCLLSLLGYETYVSGLVGNDLGERIVKEEFGLFKVNYDSLVERGGRKDLRFTRQFSHLIFPDGTHRFKKHCLKCGSVFDREYQVSKLDVDKKTSKLAEKADLLLLDRANAATLYLAQMAERNKRKIAYDLSFTSYGTYHRTTEAILKMCSLVKVNHKTFRKIMGSADNAAIMRWRETYPNTDCLLVTDGENGSYGYANINDEKEIFHRAAIKCDHVRDCGGAGDIFFGMVTSGLFLGEPPKNLADFEQIIDVSQALASLKCTLYGARALQRTYLNQKVSSKEILDSAFSILEKGRSGNSFSPTIGLPKPITEPYRLAKLSECKICGGIPKKKRRISQSKLSISLTKDSESLTRVPWTMKSSFDIGKTYRKGISEFASCNALMIGSGGSFTASVFGEALYLHSLGKLAKAMTPFEFEGLKGIDSDTAVWFVSHGGGNTDILGAALRAEKLSHSKCIVLTGNKNSKLAERAKQNGWKTVFIQSQERNFVSIIGLLSQVSALCGLLTPADEIKDLDDFFSDTNLRTHFNSAMREMRLIAYELSASAGQIDNIHIVSFARGWGWPALTDLESKIVEGGICTIEISELKNFTHGRYINLFNRPNRRVVIIKTPKDKELADYLYERLEKRIPTFVLETDEEGVIGALELLIKALFLAWYLGEISKKNILRPKFPREASGLYSWEPSYRRGYWKALSETNRETLQ